MEMEDISLLPGTTASNTIRFVPTEYSASIAPIIIPPLLHLLLLYILLFLSGPGRDIRPGITVDPKLVAKKTPLCVFVPGTARRKWKYGFSLEDLWDGMKKGCVLFDGGHINALSCNDVI